MKITRHIVVLAALAAAALFAASHAGAAGAGSGYMVTSMVGDVKILSGGKTGPVTLYKPLSGGETIITGARSMADLAIGKTGLMRIQEKSKISLASLKKAKGDPDLDMESGRVMVIKSKLSKGDGYTVKTRTSTASVRGTVFQVSEGGKESQLDVLFGSVMVNPVLDGEVQKQISELVGENQSLSLSQDQVRDILKKKKKMSTKEMRREVREALMKNMAEVRQSPEFQKLSGDIKKQIQEYIERAKKDMQEKGLDRKSLKEKAKEEKERLKREAGR